MANDGFYRAYVQWVLGSSYILTKAAVDSGSFFRIADLSPSTMGFEELDCIMGSAFVPIEYREKMSQRRK